MTTHIQWTDETWNTVSGCTRVSEGCDNCYIERTIPFRMEGRNFDKPGIGGTSGVVLHPDRLERPLHWRKPRKVFVNSMSDLFHEDIPDNYIGSMFDVMARTPQHTYQILTKRPARMRSLLKKWATQADGSPHAGASFRRHDMMWCEPAVWPLPNVWLGVSVENQKWADIRIPTLMETPAAVRFLSCEPLLGPVELTHLHTHCPTHDFDGGFCTGSCPDRRIPDWVIVGGESGPGARPMHPDWARSLRDQCVEAGMPFFFKQRGSWTWVDGDCHESDLIVRRDGYSWPLTEPHGAEDGTDVAMRKVGVRAAGRELDGRTWDEFPEVSA